MGIDALGRDTSDLLSRILYTESHFIQIKNRFKHCALEVFNALNNYQKYSVDLLNGKNPHHQSLRKERVALLEWKMHLYPFLKACQKKENFSFSQRFFDGEKIEQYLIYPYRISLENLLNSPLPYREIKNREFKSIAKTLNRFPEAVRIIHRAFSEIVQLIGDPNYTTTDLEIGLIQCGAKFFLSKDHKYLKWREGLYPGLLMEHSVLDKCLNKERKKNEPFLAFKILDKGYAMAFFGKNEAQFGIHHQLAKEKQWGIPFIKCFYFSEKYALVEKMETVLKDILWKSESQILENSDRKKALAICAFVSHMKSFGCPPRLKSKYLIFNSAGEIKSLIFLEKGDPNFELLENFCLELSKKNLNIFRYLMVVSGLYKKVKDNLPDKKSEENVIEEALQLIKKRAKFLIPYEGLEGVLKKKFWKYHAVTKAGKHVWPELSSILAEETCMEKGLFFKTNKISFDPVFLQQAEKYYKEERAYLKNLLM